MSEETTTQGSAVAPPPPSTPSTSASSSASSSSFQSPQAPFTQRRNKVKECRRVLGKELSQNVLQNVRIVGHVLKQQTTDAAGENNPYRLFRTTDKVVVKLTKTLTSMFPKERSDSVFEVLGFVSEKNEIMVEMVVDLDTTFDVTNYEAMLKLQKQYPALF